MCARKDQAVSGRRARAVATGIAAADAHRPIGPTQSLAVQLTYDPHPVVVAYPTVPAGDRLLRYTQDLGHPTARHVSVQI